MTYMTNLFDKKKPTLAIAFLLAAIASLSLDLAVAADGEEEYVSSYSSKKSRSSGYGITQYQADDEARAYQDALFSSEKDDSDEESTAKSARGYARRRYSSKDKPPDDESLEEKYDFSSNSSVEGLLVGSDEYLDAATADCRALCLEDATSGSGSKRSSAKIRGLFGFPVETNARDGDTFKERWIDPDVPKEGWTSQILPQGTMYPSYLASRKDSRLQSIINHTQSYGTLWDIALGGRTSLWRYGTTDVVSPEGWELELEGAALLRLDWEQNRNLAATDYRAGVPLVYGTRRWQFKTGYYHVSSHLGDNYLMDQFRPRVHYSRDAVMFGLAVKPTDDVRLYAEFDYAFHTGKTTEPCELQMGFEYSPQFDPNMSNWVARPFFATHAHLYQELDFGGYWATQTGLQWRDATNSLIRLGAEYFQGGDDLYQFHHHFQRKYGIGFWFDF